MGEIFDFGGYATRNDLRCADGRTIRKNAFKDCDGQTVPLVWQHQHNDPSNVLGHALLENREDGVYAYCKFNNTDAGKRVKELVHHGDIEKLSIYANQLKEKAGNVLHGFIREVSLVLSGANPGAYIDCLSLEHSDDSEFEAIIYNDEPFVIAHSSFAPANKPVPVPQPTPKPIIHSSSNNEEKTVGDILDSMTDEQKDVLLYAMQTAVETALEDKNETKNDEEETEMSHNVFENDTPNNSLTHADMETIIADGQRLGSLRDAVLAHMDHGILQHAVYNEDGSEQTYGIADIDTLFPDYKAVNDRPDWIQRETDWVKSVMNGVHHTPFSRIKSTYANITMDEARAKGYLKGHLKREEVFSLLKRTTDPQTIYKKQKLDRDDVIDITDFDVVAWIKSEMRMMLDEELARAILIGDGRLTSDDDHIQENHIRPIAKDSELYTIKVPVTAGSDADKTAKNFIRAAIKARKDYKGSGNPTLFTTEDYLTDMLLIEDGIGHLLYDSEAKLATMLRVKNIITVPVMEGFQIDGNDVMGIIVNLSDYNVGADKGGSVDMFEDFDIDYNQMKYLIETRCSGALIKPFSAMVLIKGATATTYTAVTPQEGDSPVEEGWYEKQGSIYVPSKDSSVVTGKTYYEKG